MWMMESSRHETKYCSVVFHSWEEGNIQVNAHGWKGTKKCQRVKKPKTYEVLLVNYTRHGNWKVSPLSSGSNRNKRFFVKGGRQSKEYHLSWVQHQFGPQGVQGPGGATRSFYSFSYPEATFLTFHATELPCTRSSTPSWKWVRELQRFPMVLSHTDLFCPLFDLIPVLELYSAVVFSRSLNKDACPRKLLPYLHMALFSSCFLFLFAHLHNIFLHNMF